MSSAVEQKEVMVIPASINTPEYVLLPNELPGTETAVMNIGEDSISLVDSQNPHRHLLAQVGSYGPMRLLQYRLQLPSQGNYEEGGRDIEECLTEFVAGSYKMLSAGSPIHCITYVLGQDSYDYQSFKVAYNRSRGAGGYSALLFTLGGEQFDRLGYGLRKEADVLVKKTSTGEPVVIGAFTNNDLCVMPPGTVGQRVAYLRETVRGLDPWVRPGTFTPLP